MTLYPYICVDDARSNQYEIMAIQNQEHRQKNKQECNRNGKIFSLERFRTSKGSSLSGRLRGIILHVIFSFRSHPGTNPHASHGKHLSRSRQDYSDVFLSISSIASTECAYAPPARISAATQIASISSFSVAPCRKAAFV